MENFQLLTTSPRQSHMPWGAIPSLPDISSYRALPVTSSTAQMESLYPSFQDSAFALDQCTGNTDSISYANHDDIPYPEIAFESPDVHPSPSPEVLADIPISIPNGVSRSEETYKSPERDVDTRKAKKRIQNRIAQKSFRKRKQDYVESLEMRIKQLEKELEAHRNGPYCFEGLAACLVQEDLVTCH